ncbi:unnamed protein product (macronuclear) [Paramecium tetraurelia]|uniref:Uncharacterized protein n=1 Tax=Paramecium tetraurelia TaxID=5888 RepID=A0BSW5_PARTE|nr:uncharacterized protein GSPATT00031864001 [Paramecium tetraurelia]CAK61632.1 unnamed protein product [Paramecium tetraurelia]|eukprot:XP_001429030.1 hypothetical protein (macronuclear) [Paramecium tetraurelia strain d4-2]
MNFNTQRQISIEDLIKLGQKYLEMSDQDLKQKMTQAKTGNPNDNNLKARIQKIINESKIEGNKSKIEFYLQQVKLSLNQKQRDEIKIKPQAQDLQYNYDINAQNHKLQQQNQALARTKDSQLREQKNLRQEGDSQSNLKMEMHSVIYEEIRRPTSTIEMQINHSQENKISIQSQQQSSKLIQHELAKRRAINIENNTVHNQDKIQPPDDNQSDVKHKYEPPNFQQISMGTDQRNRYNYSPREKYRTDRQIGNLPKNQQKDRSPKVKQGNSDNKTNINDLTPSEGKRDSNQQNLKITEDAIQYFYTLINYIKAFIEKGQTNSGSQKEIFFDFSKLDISYEVKSIQWSQEESTSKDIENIQNNQQIQSNQQDQKVFTNKDKDVNILNDKQIKKDIQQNQQDNKVETKKELNLNLNYEQTDEVIQSKQKEKQVQTNTDTDFSILISENKGKIQLIQQDDLNVNIQYNELTDEVRQSKLQENDVSTIMGQDLNLINEQLGKGIKSNQQEIDAQSNIDQLSILFSQITDDGTNTSEQNQKVKTKMEQELTVFTIENIYDGTQIDKQIQEAQKNRDQELFKFISEKNDMIILSRQQDKEVLRIMFQDLKLLFYELFRKEKESNQQDKEVQTNNDQDQNLIICGQKDKEIHQNQQDKEVQTNKDQDLNLLINEQKDKEIHQNQQDKEVQTNKDQDLNLLINEQKDKEIHQNQQDKEVQTNKDQDLNLLINEQKDKEIHQNQQDKEVQTNKDQDLNLLINEQKDKEIHQNQQDKEVQTNKDQDLNLLINEQKDKEIHQNQQDKEVQTNKDQDLNLLINEQKDKEIHQNQQDKEVQTNIDQDFSIFKYEQIDKDIQSIISNNELHTILQTS